MRGIGFTDEISSTELRSLNMLGDTRTMNQYPNVTITIAESQIHGYENLSYEASFAVIGFYDSADQPMLVNQGGNVSSNPDSGEPCNSGT